MGPLRRAFGPATAALEEAGRPGGYIVSLMPFLISQAFTGQAVK